MVNQCFNSSEMQQARRKTALLENLNNETERMKIIPNVEN